jgi:thiol:disulfide interchange protein DsbD
MKPGVMLLFLLFFGPVSFAQSYVSWGFSYEPTQKQVIAHAKIEEGWHLYSTQKVAEMGPIPTAFMFQETESLQVIGTVAEPTPIEAYDPNFEDTLFFFEDEVDFRQHVKGEGNLKGVVTYMVCNDSMCMPPIDVEFTIEIADEK